MPEVIFCKSPEEVAYGLMQYWLKGREDEVRKVHSDINEMLKLYTTILKAIKSPVHFLEELKGVK